MIGQQTVNGTVDEQVNTTKKHLPPRLPKLVHGGITTPMIQFQGVILSRRRQSHALCADGSWKVANDHPCRRSPRRGEEEDVESRRRLLGNSSLPFGLIDGPDCGDWVSHTAIARAPYKKRASAIVQSCRRYGCAERYNCRDNGDEERIANANGAEEGGANSRQ